MALHPPHYLLAAVWAPPEFLQEKGVAINTNVPSGQTYLAPSSWKSCTYLPMVDTRHFHFMSDSQWLFSAQVRREGQYLGDSCGKPLHGHGTCYHVLAPLWAVSGTP